MRGFDALSDDCSSGFFAARGLPARPAHNRRAGAGAGQLFDLLQSGPAPRGSRQGRRARSRRARLCRPSGLLRAGTAHPPRGNAEGGRRWPAADDRAGNAGRAYRPCRPRQARWQSGALGRAARGARAGAGRPRAARRRGVAGAAGVRDNAGRGASCATCRRDRAPRPGRSRRLHGLRSVRRTRLLRALSRSGRRPGSPARGPRRNLACAPRGRVTVRPVALRRSHVCCQRAGSGE